MQTTSLDVAIQSINAAVTPALLFTASGLLLAGLQGKYSTLIGVIRALNDERRQFQHKPSLANWEQARQRSVDRQIPYLLGRVKRLRNSVFFLYLGTLLFLIASIVIGLTHLGWPPMAPLVLALFGAGLLALMAGVVFALLDAWQSYHGVLLEVQSTKTTEPV